LGLDVLLVNRSIGMEFVEAIKGKGRKLSLVWVWFGGG